MLLQLKMSKYPYKWQLTLIITVNTVLFKTFTKIHSTPAFSLYKNKLQICINILHKTVIKYAAFFDEVTQFFYTVGY